MFLPNRFPAWVTRILLGCLMAVSLLALVRLGMRVRIELLGLYHSDVPIYLTVARGFLNGLTPYSDLFENKAPGVFLLAALSLKLTGGAYMLAWLEALCIAFLPAAIAVPLLLRERSRGGSFLAIGLIGWILGTTFALYVADQAGALLPESFGAFFAVLLIGFVWMTDRWGSWSWARIVVAAILLLITVGIKEPFFLSLIAAAMLLLPHVRDWRPLGWAFGIAAIVGIAALLLLGWAGPYFGIHLAHMFGYHVFHPWGTLGESPWLRTIDVIRVWRNLSAVSVALPWIVLVLWIGSLMGLLSGASDPRSRWIAAGRWLLGSWLVTFAVGLTGDFYGHHFVFALPFYMACIVVCTELTGPPILLRLRLLGAAVVMLLCSLLLWNMSTDVSVARRTWEQWIAPQRHVAETVDRVLDRCGLDRYFNLIDRADGFYGLTRHSPYGPIFTQYARFIGVLPAYLEAFTEALTTAPLVVMRTKEEAVPMHPDTWAYVERSFTPSPWLCVGEFRQPDPYVILFRRGLTPRMP